MPGLIAIDTNLLVLWVVGLAAPRFVATHKRTQTYTVDDFHLLEMLLSGADGLVTTPHVLAETSNLVRQFRRPGLDAVIDAYGAVVGPAREVHVPAGDALGRREFRALGLTDAALLAVGSTGIRLLTDDFDLYHAALTAGGAPINFAHEREAWLGT